MTGIKLKRTNPYSGQSIALTLQEAKLHDQIKKSGRPGPPYPLFLKGVPQLTVVLLDLES